ncbi:hypothetical protein FHX52_3222 [Humibacillus xanthopallidus]|uniref:Uncharacterized protein n=1 Tax=Humibacillus xanthopallidus TaxID=412689 RepID=A0A543PQY8_9MICO|nr:hypothetical protein [Humibacillus xanthopallidus]TQN46497.1 hypothetical protein FHX52_3222 [Humibacillus xanthopallidus]
MTDTTWSSWAERHLHNNWRSAIREALNNVSSARWHPNGFIVFRLGDVRDGVFTGSHRVHIWPGEIARRDLPGHPTIHSHDWELQSLVLNGQYADVIFGRSSEAPALVAHAVQYGGADGDSIEPTGDNVQLVRQELRTVEAGTCHHMDAGVPHETLVPDDETVVTYVMMGPRQTGGMMLAAESPFNATHFKRPGLTPDEERSASATLARVLAG